MNKDGTEDHEIWVLGGEVIYCIVMGLCGCLLHVFCLNLVVQ